MLIVTPPEEQLAADEQVVKVSRSNMLDVDFLEFNDLDIDYLAEDDLQFTELDINYLDVNLLEDL